MKQLLGRSAVVVALLFALALPACALGHSALRYNGARSAFANYYRQKAEHKLVPPLGQGRAHGLIAHSAEGVYGCGSPGYIRSSASGLFVTDEVSAPGNFRYMLRARSSVVEAWQYFQICYLSQHTGIAVYSDANKLWVTSELSYPYTGIWYGMLRARSTVVEAWQEFSTVGGASDFGWIGANGDWVTAEVGGYPPEESGLLRARSSVFGPWQEWNSNV